MPKHFQDDDLSFSYPDNWELEREENDQGWIVSVHSPGTAFMTLALYTDMPALDFMADTALEAMREVYPELEADDRIEDFAGQMAVGHNINFFSLDFNTTCWTRSFYSSQGTVLLLCQTSDLEVENEAVLRAICASFKVAGEE